MKQFLNSESKGNRQKLDERELKKFPFFTFRKGFME